MAVKLRLRRIGKRNRPAYRVCAIESRRPRGGAYIESIGFYDPFIEDDQKKVRINRERAEYWLSVGAQPTNRVARFLSEHGLTEKPVIHEQTKQHLPRKKTLERQEAKAEEEKAKAEAAAAE